jgi:uncharacterized protein (TIGR02145 family)
MKYSFFIIFLFVSTMNNAQTVTIGTQVWTTKNLDVSTFRNGDSIPECKTNEEWEKAGQNNQPAWCYYENNPANGAKYGKLYNWNAVNDPRGLAPEGFHIPSNSEWTQLIDFCGGLEIAGVKLKSSVGWNKFQQGSGNGTNSSGFNALPGGYRSVFVSDREDLGFGAILYSGYWWSSTSDNPECIGKSLRNNFKEIKNVKIILNSIGGYSVRCIKD